MAFRRFQNRLFAFFLVLLTMLQLLIFISVNDANIRNAKVVINDSLDVGASIFKRLIEERTRNLLQHARLLSADYGFKPAFYSNDHATILSAMENHLDRIEDADIMLLVDLDAKLIADSRFPERQKVPVQWPKLIQQAETDDYAEATGVVMIDEMPFQIIVVPYLSPDISAWILIGFAIDQNVAEDLKQIVNSEISFFILSQDGQWRLTNTTLNQETGEQLQHLSRQSDLLFNAGQTLLLGDEEYLSLYTQVADSHQVIGVLQRSLDEALSPYLRLKQTLQLLFVLALMLSFVGVIFIARKVTRPVKDLTEGAKKIERGDYQTKILTDQKDEIGQLANSFNRMAKGLAEKEKIRNLLGKVVSSDIAEELLSKEIELGGEEKEATILFSDIREFTQLCEGVEPKQILEILNVYLTEMSELVELNKGVIDKYIGDAIMAIFGAPTQHGDDANNAVTAALAMTAALTLLNQARQGSAPMIKIGIGLNTATVVAGNMGSPNRLNYTVIGDGVNLSSRLEGLTKFYGLEILVSESTKMKAKKFVYQESIKYVSKENKMQYQYLDRFVKNQRSAHVNRFKLNCLIKCYWPTVLKIGLKRLTCSNNLRRPVRQNPPNCVRYTVNGSKSFRKIRRRKIGTSLFLLLKNNSPVSQINVNYQLLALL